MTDPVNPRPGRNGSKFSRTSVVVVTVALLIPFLVATIVIVIGISQVRRSSDDVENYESQKLYFDNNSGSTINIRIATARGSEWVSTHSVGQFWSSDRCTICGIRPGRSISVSHGSHDTEEMAAEIHHISASDADSQRVIFVTAITHEQLQARDWLVNVTDQRESQSSPGSAQKSLRTNSPVRQIFSWILWLVFPGHLLWFGFLQIRHKQAWVLTMWSLRYIKNEEDPLSPKTLGIDSRSNFFKFFMIGRVPMKVAHAVESEEGQKLLNSPETWTMRLITTITGWTTLAILPIWLLMALFPADR